MPDDPDLLRDAEQAVIEAAEAWEVEQRRATRAPASGTSQQLRIAVYMLRKARDVTGNIKLSDVRAAIAERDEKGQK